jgi:hypothetical protein
MYSDKESTNTLALKLDSVQTLLDSVLKRIPIVDTITISKKKDTLIKQNKTNIISPSQSQPSLKKLEKQPLVITPTTHVNEQIFYYTSSKQISIRFFPWIDGRRLVVLYHPNGTESYRIEDVRHSYTSITSVRQLHPNGAVASLHIDLNPGASMYMYDTDITFDTQNYPLWKKNNQWPTSLEEQTKAPEYWDRIEKKWKIQEVIKEQPVPQIQKDTTK